MALNAYGVLSGRHDIRHIGGAEVQQVRIASWLVERGYPVSFVTLDHGQPDGADIRGIRVYKAYARQDGIRGLRFLHPRWSGLWSAMARADSQVYYQRGAGSETGQVALWCHLHRRKCVFATANESDCDARLYALKSWKEKALYRSGLRLAAAVVAQTETQQSMLARNLGVSAVLVRNCGWAPASRALEEPSPSVHAGPPRVLWIGRIRKHKRFHWLLDVAERCPAIPFDVVGAGNADSDYVACSMKRAAMMSNVKVHGWIPHRQIDQHYSHGRCVLCCTSEYEGFPNTFLEAWSLGVPVVSTFDPDGAIQGNGLGFVAHDIEGITTSLKEIAESDETWSAASRAARHYYVENHSPEVCLPVFERLLLGIAG